MIAFLASFWVELQRQPSTKRAGVTRSRLIERAMGVVLAVLLSVTIDALPSFAESSDDSTDAEPKGFFTRIELAHGYKTAKDVFQTDRYKPDRPSTVFTPDVDAIYVVFEILPRENPAHILGQLFLEKGDGRPNDTLLYEEGVYLQTSQDSGFLELPRPTDGWVPGNYKIRIHIGERVTQASQLGTLRFKVVPSK